MLVPCLYCNGFQGNEFMRFEGVVAMTLCRLALERRHIAATTMPLMNLKSRLYKKLSWSISLVLMCQSPAFGVLSILSSGGIVERWNSTVGNFQNVTHFSPLDLIEVDQ